MSISTLQQLAAQEKTRREILHKSELIPPLPDLVSRLLTLLNKPDTEPHHLEQLMQNDQVLVAKMLALVNSPFYGLSRPITTIRDAVMVLGFRGVRSLVLATSTARFLQRDFACYGHEPKGLWLHAVAVAAGAKHLARSRGMGQEAAELLFVGGLLHDIGKLVVGPYLAQRNLAIQPNQTDHDAERNAIGIDHTEAGALVTAKWNLSQELQELIKAHHDVTGNANAAIVRLADAVAMHRGIGYLPGRAPTPTVQPQDLTALSMDREGWQRTELELAEHMAESINGLANLGG